MKVEQVMNQPVVACHPADRLSVAAGLMWEHDCGVIPVVDADDRLVGVVTDRDICMAAMMNGLPLAALAVEETMSEQVVTCRPEDAVEEVEATMALRQLRRLPVVDGSGHAVGVVSLNDLAREAVGDLANEKELRADSAVTRTLAAISQPRNTITAPAAKTTARRKAKGRKKAPTPPAG